MKNGASARLLWAASWVNLVVLIVVALTLRYLGERSFLTLILLYLPRWPLLAPLLMVFPAALGRDRRWLLPVHATAALVLLFPLLGMCVPVLGTGTSGKNSIRIMSYNVWYGQRGHEAILREVRAAGADIVLFQATPAETEPAWRRLLSDYHLHVTTEFLLASRFPIREVRIPEDLSGSPGIPASYVHYTLETPAGLIDLFNVHPFSPRPGFDQRDSYKEIDANTEIRRRQVQVLAEEAAQARHPVIIAGDTNLPGLSWIYHRYLDGYQDGFAQAGLGFGYTFPAHLLPWMRIDRILGGTGVRFLRFVLGTKAGSDHLPVIAEVGLGP